MRNALSGWAVSDIDIAVPMPPAETLQRLESAAIKAVPTGLEHGTVTAIVSGQPFEVTSLRRDVETDGRHAVVAYTDDWEEDSARRDFTMNALYAAARWRDLRLSWRRGRPDRGPGSLCRRRSRAHPGRLSAHPAPVPLSCLVRQGRDGCGRLARRRRRQGGPGAIVGRAHRQGIVAASGMPQSGSVAALDGGVGRAARTSALCAAIAAAGKSGADRSGKSICARRDPAPGGAPARRCGGGARRWASG